MPGKAKHGPKRSEQTAAPGQTVWMDPVGRCIYCGMTSDNLRDEHVFPRALGGNVIVPKASCLSCQKITSYIEGYCTRDRLFGAVRIQHRLPTRRPKERPTSLPIIETFYPSPELAPKVLIPIEDHPSVLILPVFEPPGVLLRRVPQIAGFFIANLTQDDRERTDRILAQGREGVKFYEEFKPGVFARLLAKIAHAAAAGRFGVDAFTHRLPKIILGEDGDAFDWAGGSTPEIPAPGILPDEHRVVLHQFGTETRVVDGVTFLVAQIRFFSYLAPTSPAYTVVVGEFSPSHGASD